MIGTNLLHYRIDSELGRGGMGVVYKATDEKLKRPVALKVLSPKVILDLDSRARFMREAEAAAAVTHPNIATIYQRALRTSRNICLSIFLGHQAHTLYRVPAL